ncbi:DgyrCDS5460 [Dimorphilus gyrociliatus]|uniref:DgyrCDS5460 n=1 Tax=Dimorphilus gyrociliatus TaxID=2664684 RepID=A0A7I8VKM2_9ANNE|nr:DgyrCDS5460 [Dimorphilus gyrociliatus]
MNDRKGIALDGGYGWLIVLASFVNQALTVGITYTFGVILVKLLDTFKSEESTTAWIGSIQSCLLYLVGIIGGPLIRRFGWRVVAISGSILSAIGFASSGLVNNLYLLYLTYGIITGIGNGLVYLTSMVCIQHYFDKRRALATGIVVSGSGVGMLLFSVATPALLKKIEWRATFFVQAAIMLSGSFFSALYKPIKMQVLSERTPLMESSCEETEKKSKHSSFTIDLSLFQEPIFIIFCISLLSFGFSYHVPFTYTPDRAIHISGGEITLSDASIFVSIMGISSVIGRLIMGSFSDTIPNIRFYIFGSVLILGGILNMSISIFTTYIRIVFYSILFGVFSGFFAALFPVVLVDLLGVNEIEKSMGQALAVTSFGFLVASPLSGKFNNFFLADFVILTLFNFRFNYSAYKQFRHTILGCRRMRIFRRIDLPFNKNYHLV